MVRWPHRLGRTEICFAASLHESNNESREHKQSVHRVEYSNGWRLSLDHSKLLMC